jgi:hypothetical protein
MIYSTGLDFVPSPGFKFGWFRYPGSFRMTAPLYSICI